MNKIEEILKNQKIVIADGATGTELERKGYDIKDSLWSAKFLMDNPQVICEVHRDYLDAGSDCITTLSYQATFEGFMKKGLSEDEAKKIIESSVKLAIDTRDEFWNNLDNKDNRAKPLVAASIGPYGAFLADGSEFTGNYGLNEDELVSFHQKRMKTIIDANPDILACETVPCLMEAKAYVKLLEQFPNTQAWISFSAKDGKHINSGESIKECAKYLDAQKQIAAIGINCTAPQYIESLIQEIKEVSTKPIIVYPNGGAVYDGLTKTWSTQANNSTYGKMAQMWYEKGASIIGGCCQTTPSDIEQISNWIRK